MNGNALTERIEVRLDAETKQELEEKAEREDRKPASVARRLIKAGLAAEREQERVA